MQKADSENRRLSILSAAIKQAALLNEIPIIALSQLNRDLEHRTDQRPRLSDLRDSGSLEQDADIVLFLHRPKYKQYSSKGAEYMDKGAITELILAKNRNGETGLLLDAVKFDGATTSFKNIDYDEPIATKKPTVTQAQLDVEF